MITYSYSPLKNAELILKRGISFEKVIAAIMNDQVLDIVAHSNPDRYKGQKIYIIRMDNYAYLVPFIEEENNSVFLKTIIPCRKATKRYLKKEEL
jgi:uncharacterized DUF497 family protein